MAHNFDISKLTGRLQQLAYLADTDRSNHIDTETEYSLFENYAKSDLEAGTITEADYKGIFGLETATKTEEVTPSETTSVAITNPIAVSKKEAKRDQEKIKDSVKDMVKQGVTPQELISELKNKYTNPQFASVINEVQEVLNIVNGTNYNSKDDVKNIHDTAKKALKAAGKWDGFHKDVLSALEDQAEANQIEKEFQVMLVNYNEVKAACKAEGLAPNFEEYVKVVKENFKDKKSYTKQALKQLEDWARDEAMGVQEVRLEASQGTSKRQIRKELRAQNTAGDAYQNDAIQDLKTERRIFARKHKAEKRGKELSHLNKETLISELGKRGYQYNFVKKAAAHKIGTNIYDKLKNKYLETIKNEDGTYDLSKLQDDLLNYVGQDYKVNQSKDEQMSEMFNIKVRLKDLTGEDFTDNETKVLLNVLEFDREHKDHAPKLGKAVYSGIVAALGAIGAIGNGEIRQHVGITIKLGSVADAKEFTDLLKQQGVKTSTEEVNGQVNVRILVDQTVRAGLLNILKGAGIGVLTSAMLDIIVGNKPDEKSCFSVSDYNKDDPTYTDPEKYKKHFANTTKNKAKSDAMNTLVDAYVEKYGENWHSELHNTILKTAGIGSKMNPEECRVLRFQKPEAKPPVQPEQETPVKTEQDTPVKTEPVKCGVDMDEQKVDTTYTHTRKGGDSWDGIVSAYYPCLVEEQGLVKAKRTLKIALSLEADNDFNGNSLIAQVEQGKSWKEIANTYYSDLVKFFKKDGLNQTITILKTAIQLNPNAKLNCAKMIALLKGGDLPEKMYLPEKIGDCKRVDNAQVKKVRVHGGGRALIQHVGSKSGYTQYTATDGCDDSQKATGRTAQEAMANLKAKTGKTYTNEADYQ